MIEVTVSKDRVVTVSKDEYQIPILVLTELQ